MASPIYTLVWVTETEGGPRTLLHVLEGKHEIRPEWEYEGMTVEYSTSLDPGDIAPNESPGLPDPIEDTMDVYEQHEPPC